MKRLQKRFFKSFYLTVMIISMAGIFSLSLGMSAVKEDLQPVEEDQKAGMDRISGEGLPKPSFTLSFPGKEDVVDYMKYGEFEGVGTDKYRYIIKDRNGLSDAVGGGIYPNYKDIRRDKEFQRIEKKKGLEGNHWAFINSGDPQIDFFAWTQAPEHPGVKLYFAAEALRQGNLIKHALKAYYATIIHFPNSYCWSADHKFVWYIAPESLKKIRFLLREYPEMGIDLEGAKVKIINGNDTDLTNDIISVNPGRFVPAKGDKRERVNLEELSVKLERGKGKVRLINFSNGHWQILVDDAPYIVKGISYSPTRVGDSPTGTCLNDWMFSDINNNGIIDSPYESWVDKNGNNRRDKDEPIVGDFELLRDMGCNAVRLYHSKSNYEYIPDEYNKELLKDLFAKYGIRVIMGDFLGAYTVGSGANWDEGTDYRDKKQRKRMKGIVKDMVLDHKDEPYVLMWLLGNENNMPSIKNQVNDTRTNASVYPKDYVIFVNEVAKMIHELDPDHPVAVGNLGLDLIEYYSKYTPEIDIFGTNAYWGESGFGDLWSRVRDEFDRPVLITEYGCDSYCVRSAGIDEDKQAEYHIGNWRDIEYNLAGGVGAGNSIGGVIFEWLDEWWKSPTSSPKTHDTTKDVACAFPDGWSNEEWLGIVGQGDGSNSPFLRRLRKSYGVYRDIWNKKEKAD